MGAVPTSEFSGPEALILAEIGDPADCKCLNFNHLSERTGLTREQVAVSCRSLKSKGVADCYNGLWTDDGEPYGSGYGLSRSYITELRAAD